MLLGVSHDEATVDLSPDYVLLAYTDGVTGAHGPGKVEFGGGAVEDPLRKIRRFYLPIYERSPSRRNNAGDSGDSRPHPRSLHFSPVGDSWRRKCSTARDQKIAAGTV